MKFVEFKLTSKACSNIKNLLNTSNKDA